MRIPSKSAMTGAGRSEANAANAVFLACRAYKPRAANCAAYPTCGEQRRMFADLETGAPSQSHVLRPR
jgi:hypothetical protein